MKKSSFVALVLGTISGVCFSLGMCMALIPEWNALKEGIVAGSAGLVLAVITILIWRKMENKTPVKLNSKSLLKTIYAIISSLVFGVGLCLCLVANNFITGIVIGVVGIVMLLMLIPMTKGFKE